MPGDTSLLLLYNAAPNYHHLMNRLARNFLSSGVDVSIVVDSAYTRELAQVDSAGCKVVELPAGIYKVAEGLREEILEFLHKETSLNFFRISYADYNRTSVYGYPPLLNKADSEEKIL